MEIINSCVTFRRCRFFRSMTLIYCAVSISGLMKDAMFTKKILSLIVKTNNFNGDIELGMNHFVKCLKTREKITFIFQLVNSSSLRIIIKNITS